MPLRNRLWPVIGLLCGAAFVIEALLHAPGIAYAVTAVATGFTYSIISVLTRGQRGPGSTL